MGFLNLYKVAGPTSHDVVARLRKALRDVRVGHGGTLDPAAEGVLPICVGGATKYFDYLLESRKTYLATIRLGVITATQDRDGEVVEERPVGPLDPDAFSALLSKFEGDIEQIPPMYSARRYQGKRLYELARAGIEVERPVQRGKVHWIRLLSVDPPHVTFEVECGRGTYVRTLCHDIGLAWGTGGHLARLTRRAVGSFRVEDAVSVEEAEEQIRQGRLKEILIPVGEGLAFLPCVSLIRVPSGGLRKGLWILEGVFARRLPEGPPGSHVRLVNDSGRTLALARILPGEPVRLQVRKVIDAPGGTAD
ncbi:MAG: tRNA pseudouridine(55) synthase TruB [Nitrospinota bacterium]